MVDKITLYTNNLCAHSHQVRFMLCEKNLEPELVEIDLDNRPDALFEANPYGTIPVVVMKDIVLYDISVILHFIDERYPHPSMLPVYPSDRARNRLLQYRVEKEFYSRMENILTACKAIAEQSRQDLISMIVSLSPIFQNHPFLCHDEITILDCKMAPLLWRFPLLGIDLSKKPSCKPVLKYMDRIFTMESFQKSLSEEEGQIRDGEYWDSDRW